MIGLLRPDEYYTPLGQGTLSSQLYEIGQFFWAPSLFLLDNNRRQAVKSSYSEGSGEQFRLDPVDLPTEFNQPGDISHPLGIRTDERALVIGAKRRPVIVLSQAAAMWSDAPAAGQNDCYLVAPVYTFSGDDTRASYSPAFIDRVKGYVYWQFFYLPARGNTSGSGAHPRELREAGPHPSGPQGPAGPHARKAERPSDGIVYVSGYECTWERIYRMSVIFCSTTGRTLSGNCLDVDK